MTRTVFCFVAWMPALLVALGASRASAVEILPDKLEGKIKWVYRYDEGKQLARASGKPLFVVFRCER